jgi:DNA-binding IclR family transcriptional regulator
MSTFTKVPAIYKCFAILELLAKSKTSPSISEIARQLDLNKSTVCNTIHSLVDLGVMEFQPDGKFVFGPRFYVLGNMAGQRSELLQIARPYLTAINEHTKLSAFLGIRSNLNTVLIDKVDSALEIKVSSEIGMQMPPLAGAGIKAMLSQLSDPEIDAILSQSELTPFTPNSIVNKADYKQEIIGAGRAGIAFDREEYIEGLIAIAIPVQTYGNSIQAAIWVVGLKRQMPENLMLQHAQYLKKIGEKITIRYQ